MDDVSDETVRMMKKESSELRTTYLPPPNDDFQGAEFTCHDHSLRMPFWKGPKHRPGDTAYGHPCYNCHNRDDNARREKLETEQLADCRFGGMIPDHIDAIMNRLKYDTNTPLIEFIEQTRGRSFRVWHEGRCDAMREMRTKFLQRWIGINPDPVIVGWQADQYGEPL